MKLKTAPNGKIYLNLGCGSHFFNDWNNLDLTTHSEVIQHDIRSALPLPDTSVDVTYNSHVLEHLTPAQGRFFLAEQERVLKPGGVCRIAVPDLERICRDYLFQLEQVTRDPTPGHHLDYQWGVLQLLDQMVRLTSGGEMRKALDQGTYNEAFVRSRFGDELLPPPEKSPQQSSSSPKTIAPLFRRIARRLRHPFRRPPTVRETGEIHQWMYDRYSLQQLLTEIGFTQVAVKSHLESNIPDWTLYNLDLSANGQGARKPDSIFVEARKST